MFEGGGPKVDPETLWRAQRLTLAEVYGVAPYTVDDWPAQDALGDIGKAGSDQRGAAKTNLTKNSL